MNIERIAVLFCPLAILSCASNKGLPELAEPIHYVYLAKGHSTDQIKADSSACSDIASHNSKIDEKEELEIRKKGSMFPIQEPKRPSTIEYIGLPILGTILCGGTCLANAMISLHSQDWQATYEERLQLATRTFYQATCMQDRGYAAVILTDEEKTKLKAAKTAATTKELLDAIYRREAKTQQIVFPQSVPPPK